LADSSAPIRDQEGKIVGAVLVFLDVTVQRKTEQELARAKNSNPSVFWPVESPMTSTTF
jgi:signal transduction histidine kinase